MQKITKRENPKPLIATVPRHRLEAETTHHVAALVQPGETKDGAQDNKGYSWGTVSSRNQYWKYHSWKMHNRRSFALLGTSNYGLTVIAVMELVGQHPTQSL